jgi:hypothetical protein
MTPTSQVSVQILLLLLLLLLLLMMMMIVIIFFVHVYRGLSSCTSLLENVSLRVPSSNLRVFSLFGVCPTNKHCPSARCVYAETRWVKKN